LTIDEPRLLIFDGIPGSPHRHFNKRKSTISIRKSAPKGGKGMAKGEDALAGHQN
jgi:hypothetical protein